MLRDFASRLFPPDILSYIPGQKFVVALLAYVLAEALGWDGGVVDLPVVGLVNVNEAITLAAFYLWPSEPADGDEIAKLAVGRLTPDDKK